MTDSRLRLILQTLTNVLFGGVISAAWLMGKIQADTALLPLLAIAGFDVMGRRNEAKAEIARASIDSSAPAPSSDVKAGVPLPSPGHTAAILLMALEAAKQVMG